MNHTFNMCVFWKYTTVILVFNFIIIHSDISFIISEKSKGLFLRDVSIETIKPSLLLQCCKRCLQTPVCKSISFNKQLECYINIATASEYPQNLEKQDGSIYLDREEIPKTMNPCGSVTCPNNNRCVKMTLQLPKCMESEYKTCKSGWTLFDNSCYFWNKGTMTYNQAVNYCSERGAIVLEIYSEKEWQFIEELKTGYSGSIWIGLTDQEKEGTFVWNSGRPYTFNKFIAPEPNNYRGVEDCVILQPTKWNDISCSNNYSVICKL